MMLKVVKPGAAALPSKKARGLETTKLGSPSSSVIVIVAAEGVDKTALTGALNVRVKVSFSSSSRSPNTGTLIGVLVWPGANDSVPLVAV